MDRHHHQRNKRGHPQDNDDVRVPSLPHFSLLTIQPGSSILRPDVLAAFQMRLRQGSAMLHNYVSASVALESRVHAFVERKQEQTGRRRAKRPRHASPLPQRVRIDACSHYLFRTAAEATVAATENVGLARDQLCALSFAANLVEWHSQECPADLTNPPTLGDTVSVNEADIGEYSSSSSSGSVAAAFAFAEHHPTPFRLDNNSVQDPFVDMPPLMPIYNSSSSSSLSETPPTPPPDSPTTPMSTMSTMTTMTATTTTQTNTAVTFDHQQVVSPTFSSSSSATDPPSSPRVKLEPESELDIGNVCAHVKREFPLHPYGSDDEIGLSRACKQEGAERRNQELEENRWEREDCDFMRSVWHVDLL